MRLVFVSNLYPPVAVGGYEVECSSVVDGLRDRHDVLVVTSDRHRDRYASEPAVRRDLAHLTSDAAGALRAPVASFRATRLAREVLAWRPDLVYVWNGSQIPQAFIRVLADSGTPMAFRVCEHWFGRLFVSDQFLRELLPADGSLVRRPWAAGCRALNAMPGMRLEPSKRFRAAISWNSEAIRQMAGLPSAVEPALERVLHSVPRNGDRYAELVRAPAETAEIAFLGRVTPYKGVDVAIQALALLRDTHGVTARLVVAGPEDPGYGDELRQLAARLGVTGDVDWRGQVDPAGVAEILARAHALIVPSTWDEPFPLVTIEGAFARVPLVASDVGGVSEGMQDEEHALLFARRDAAGAAAALHRTLSSPVETDARVARARAHAERFRLRPYVVEQERFVEEAIAVLS